MTIKNSCSVRGFFDSDLHRSTSDNAVTVPAKCHAAVLVGQAQGNANLSDARDQPQLLALASAKLEFTRAASVRAIKRADARRIEN